MAFEAYFTNMNSFFFVIYSVASILLIILFNRGFQGRNSFTNVLKKIEKQYQQF